MPDDNLPSLDFTQLGAFDDLPKQPVPAPSASKGAQSEASFPVHLPAALVDAATLHAAGEELEAMRRLEAAIKGGEDLGEAEAHVWGALFEVLQALGRHQAFDALALAFARRFEQSPPTWAEETVVQHKAHATTGGHAHVQLTNVLDVSAGEVLKQALKLAQASTVVRIDLAGLVAADNAGATLLLRALAALKKAKKDVVLNAPEHLAKVLSDKLVPGQTKNEAMWLLLLDLYQQAFMQNEFEEAAVNYAVAFEKSPPSWETQASRAVAPSTTASPPPRKTEGFALRGQMIGAGRAEFAALEAAAAGHEEIVIDASQLKRIDAASANVLHQVVSEFNAAGKKIVIRGLSVLNAAFLEVLGVAQIAELVERPV